jgi:hypothetical protein
MDSSSLIWASLLALVGGLGIMLYGVELTAGASTNLPMLVGGAIIVVAILLLSWAAMLLDEPEDEHGHAETADH